MIKFNAIALSVLSISSIFLTSCSSQAQSNPRQSHTTNAKQPVVNDWSQYKNIETQFMQGCVGEKQEKPPQRIPKQISPKQKFCKCALNAYETRYPPQLFLQINALSTQLGANGLNLVHLMMKPDLDNCSTNTHYHP